MTTARDVIARHMAAVLTGPVGCATSYMMADNLIDDLLSAPDSVRLELATKLNPWRAIETAPMNNDENNIWLGWYSTDGEWHQLLGYWDGDEWRSDGYEIDHCKITHWCPPNLPAPPSEDKL